MIRISALSARTSFLEQIRNFAQNHYDIMLCFIGDNMKRFQAEFNSSSDILILDHAYLDLVEGQLLKEVKMVKPDILIFVLLEIKVDTNIASWLASSIDGIAPYYLGEKDIYQSVQQLFIKRKLIHPDFAALIYYSFQSSSTIKTRTSLKPKSKVVLELLSQGKSYAQIAEKMDISIDSVRYYIKDIYNELGIKNKGAAVGMYLRGQIA